MLRQRWWLASLAFHLFIGVTLSLLIGSLAEVYTSRLYSDNQVLMGMGQARDLLRVQSGSGSIQSGATFRRGSFSCRLCSSFAKACMSLRGSGVPSWSHQSRSEYVMNNLFGPACGDTECLYTIGSATVLVGIGYSLGALIALVGTPGDPEKDSADH